MAKLLLRPDDLWDRTYTPTFSETLIASRDEWTAAEKADIAHIRKEIKRRARPLEWESAEGFSIGADLQEPVVPISDLYKLGDSAWLTVNEYGALALQSHDLGIADIDVSGPAESAHLAEYPECNVLFENLIALKQLDAIAGTNLAQQAYRVYRTNSGFRVICASLPMDRREPRGKALADIWLRVLQADPKYIHFCKQLNSFRARLTPKPTRVKGQDGFTHVYDLMDGLCVACFEQHGSPASLLDPFESVSPGIHPNLVAQIRCHDEMCLPLDDKDRVA